MAENVPIKEEIRDAIKKGHRFMRFYYKKGTNWIKYVELLNGEIVEVVPKKKKKPLQLEGVIEVRYL